VKILEDIQKKVNRENAFSLRRGPRNTRKDAKEKRGTTDSNSHLRFFHHEGREGHEEKANKWDWSKMKGLVDNFEKSVDAFDSEIRLFIEAARNMIK